MTVTIKATEVNGYYIEITQNKYSTAYEVSKSEMYGDGLCGHTESKIYGTLKQAQRRFNDLVKQA